ncbi:MAG: valine--tRNA ligase [Candidatus Buchananbacteria bacterium RIFCSPHIGHO2_01_FULL_46_12]|uniref:Valine--tRNA ligase n=1 Tax=Candidatus Buchananbacteria bacterium RIFCSPHIGHO2_01_FULL_46_12 TaxID=1797536 RepID=A0A1G1Y6N0_9BACT|nr:MAG: valine--tRNA ligase [Candidatus Buchananbacteria bacterium RIFCSPHIGHO2_01_FULL_46_12]
MAENSYNFTEREAHWRRFWREQEIYKFNPESQKPFYSVDTPPPYVSADHLHVGHIMSYSQAEFIVRYKRMAGFEVFYPMGFDDNGLPTERFVEKKYRLNKNKISRAEFIKKCLEETKIGSQTYRNLWELLGISVDWSKTYSTIDRHSQKISQWSFLDLYQKGKMVRKDEPTFWCVACQTAVAQADLEDKEEQSFLNYINFTAEQDGRPLLIATTRPELLPACAALFVNPNDERYADLAGKTARVPLFDYSVPILTDEAVDINFGTGLMMVCTWGDNEDVVKTKAHNLPIRSTINPDGRLNGLAGEFTGLKLTEARKQIIEKLKEKNYLVKQEEISHILNVHERCGTPVELVKTKQWFIKVLDARAELLAQAEKMNWHPLFMKQRYLDWVRTLKWDWCISRQRYYGVPFPVWYCRNCGEAILPEVEDLPVDPTLTSPKIKKCPACGGKDFVPESDVMDTWMTSSCTPLIISRLFEDKKIQARLYPSSLRPQAFEIIRTWLFYTVVKSFYHHGLAPFFDIMISGHGHDEKGQKISKRLGNFVDPEKIVAQYGADALRYWATGANLGENLRYNEQEIKKGKRTTTKLYNAAQFCFSHFQNRDYAKLETKNLLPEDKWILARLNETIKKATADFDAYQYARAKNEIDEFFWSAFCDNYLEFVKYRLYREKPDETAKQVLYQVFWAISRMYAPILPFIAEEIYHLYFHQFEKAKSIHLCSWPKVIASLPQAPKEEKEFEQVIAVILAIRKFKSEQKISLAKEIPEFAADLPVSEKYFDFIKAVAKVEKIAVK